MTNPTRMEIAEAFRKAILILENGEKMFICHALERQHTAGAAAAKKIILERLSPHDAYGSWLKANFPEDHEQRYRYAGPRIAPRLYWLDALIEEFSA